MKSVPVIWRVSREVEKEVLSRRRTSAYAIDLNCAPINLMQSRLPRPQETITGCSEPEGTAWSNPRPTLLTGGGALFQQLRFYSLQIWLRWRWNVWVKFGWFEQAVSFGIYGFSFSWFLIFYSFRRLNYTKFHNSNSRLYTDSIKYANVKRVLILRRVLKK